MKIIDHVIECGSRSDRVEIFPFYDLHIDKRNCAEHAIRRQVTEIQRRREMPGRHVRVIFGGDQFNGITPRDLRRFDFGELASWLLEPELKLGETQADAITRMLQDISAQAVKRFCKVFKPVADVTIGALYGNHEKSLRNHQNYDVHSRMCEQMDIADLSDEVFVRIKFRRKGTKGTAAVKLYLRHGYGGGRTAGAEPNKLQRMLDEWEDADVCLSGHSHCYCVLPPKPVLWVPSKGKYPSDKFFYRYRFAANPGCWLYSHMPGPGNYESMSAYPARPMMTLKIVIWPFWGTSTGKNGKRQNIEIPKIEVRSYPIIGGGYE